MATIPIGADRTVAAVRAARRGYRVLQNLPLIPLLILGALTAMAVLAPVVAPHSKLDPVKPTREQCLAKFNFPDCPYVDNAPPFWARGGTLDTPLGTDSLGRDVLSRLMHGARISLVFALLLSSVREPGLWNVVLILALVFWSRYSRAVRGEVLTLRERDFVKLAEINGIGKPTIIRRHLIPNVMNTVMVLFSLQVGVAVIIEASLSFLGFGVPPPEPSWGLMMAQERESLMEGRWWLEVFPGICITMLVLSANMLGDWLRVRLDPQLRNR